jgi:hypothetical protein
MFAAAVALLVLAIGTPVAHATKTVRKIDPASLKEMCEASGGLFFPPNANGVYACLTKSGDLVSCGGTSNDCSINREGQVPPKRQVRSVVGATSGVAPE